MTMNQTTIDRARFNMIEQQVRTWDVLDQRVLDTMSTIPREAFVPERYAALAFADTHVPLGQGQVMMDPKLEGRLLQALDIKPGDTVLEVGTGSGYLTACLASLGRQVTSIDIISEFTHAAAAKLAAHDYQNVHLETGDALATPGGRHIIRRDCRHRIAARAAQGILSAAEYRRSPVCYFRQSAHHGGPPDYPYRSGQLGPGEPVRNLHTSPAACAGNTGL